VLAGLEGRDGHRPVKVVVNADVDRVDARVFEHRPEVGEDLWDVVALGQSLGRLLVDVGDGRHRRARYVRVRLVVGLARGCPRR